MLFDLLFIAIGVAMVSFGARIMVRGASSLARRLNVSDLAIGLTVVAFGTSAPELIVSLMAAVRDQPDVAIGNVIGSNTMNILVILGASALITPLKVHENTVFKEIPLSLLGVLVAFVMAFDGLIDGADNSVISRSDGLILLAFMVIFLYYMFELVRNSPEEAELPDVQHLPLWLALGMIVLGLVGLTYGGSLIVDHAVSIARMFGISEAVIGLTLVSIGTSIPELATSLVAAIQRKADIAVGNIVGSNIFNTFLILGTSAVVTPLPLGNIGIADFMVCIAASILLLIACFIPVPRIVYRLEGSVFLAIYIAYVVWLLQSA